MSCGTNLKVINNEMISENLSFAILFLQNKTQEMDAAVVQVSKPV